MVLIFVFAIVSLSACKSTNKCSSVEKQEIINKQTKSTSATEVIT